MKLVYKAPAKINLFLRVTGKRDDGFHEISSLFSMIDLYDLLEVEPADDDNITLTQDSDDLTAGEENIIFKAAMALRQEAGLKMGAKINLKKNIPISAGLGGGSSDAAAALICLNRLWDISLSRSELAKIGESIGSDIPFFLGSAASWVTGRGEKLKPISVSKTLPLLLVKPAFGISAGDAYRGSDFNYGPVKNGEAIIEDFITGSPTKIAGNLVNDLEPWAMETYPALVALKEKIKETTPLGVLMSGSGSTLFGIYENEREQEDAHKIMRDKAAFVYMAKALISAPQVIAS